MSTRVGQLYPRGRSSYESVVEGDQTTFAKQRVKAVISRCKPRNHEQISLGADCNVLLLFAIHKNVTL
jgi:hypothetical protein